QTFDVEHELHDLVTDIRIALDDALTRAAGAVRARRERGDLRVGRAAGRGLAARQPRAGNREAPQRALPAGPGAQPPRRRIEREHARADVEALARVRVETTVVRRLLEVVVCAAHV